MTALTPCDRHESAEAMFVAMRGDLTLYLCGHCAHQREAELKQAEFILLELAVAREAL